MKLKTQLMDELAVNRALNRLSYEIIERSNLDNLVLVGIKTRGVPIAKIIKSNILKNSNVDIPLLELDITHFRDDNRSEVKVKSSPNLPVEGKDVVLVDDVLFTGRTTRAAIDAVFNSGRASSIRLVVLVDRGHRELPIRADFVGKNVPTSLKEKIIVNIAEIDGETTVNISEE